MTYIKENIFTKVQKLYSPPRKLKAGNKMPALLLKKPLCTGDLSWHATATAKNYVFIGYKLKILFSGGGEGGWLLVGR